MTLAKLPQLFHQVFGWVMRDYEYLLNYTYIIQQ